MKKNAGKPGVKIFEGDFSKINLEREFDIVNAFDVAYHVVDDDLWSEFVGNLCMHTRNHGFIFISDTFRRDYREKITYVKFRPLTAYEKILKRYKVRVLSLVPIYAILGWPFTGRERLDTFLTTLYGYFTYTCRRSEPLTFLAYHIDSLLTQFKPLSLSTKLLTAQKSQDIND